MILFLKITDNNIYSIDYTEMNHSSKCFYEAKKNSCHDNSSGKLNKHVILKEIGNYINIDDEW
jgi:hypothetical protein